MEQVNYLILERIQPAQLLREIRAAGMQACAITPLGGGGYELHIWGPHSKDVVMAIVDAHDHTYVPPPPPPDPEIEVRRQLEDLIATFRDPQNVGTAMRNAVAIARIAEWIDRYGRRLS